MTMATMKIDFVSDVSCPWCAIGLQALEQALQAIGDEIQVEFHVQPFELNPAMAPEGEDIVEHLAHKYGIDAQQIAQNRSAIQARGAAVGFAFGERSRIWNTFDAHRLLHWAGVEGAAGQQRALKHALLQAYHGQGRNPGAPEVLLELAQVVGLDADRARQVIDSDEYGLEVRQAETLWQQSGIHAVPAVIVNQRHLISGGQPPEVFEQALRQVAAET